MSESLRVAIAQQRIAGGTAAALTRASLTNERKHAELRALSKSIVEEVLIGLSPRFWTREMNRAWHLVG